MRFSTRYTASKGKSALILEDAPKATRTGYVKGLLGQFVGNDRKGYGQRVQPLDITETHQAFIALIRDEADPWDYDPSNAWVALTSHLKDCSWLDFYDFLELVGASLIKRDDEHPFDDPGHFKSYQAKVNALLQEDGIGWSLNDKSELVRQIPKALASRVASTEKLLSDSYTTARIHYQKALRYLYQHPVDEANSIKEIISALESVAKVLAPKASTLGDAIKQFRKEKKHPAHLLDAVEKLYVYTNATPLVRHGHVSGSVIKLPEAELAVHIGVNFIRYLIDTRDA